MISPELVLDTISGLCKRTSHDCRVVDQDIDALDAFIDTGSGFSNSVLAAEVQRKEPILYVWIGTADTIDHRLDLG